MAKPKPVANVESATRLLTPQEVADQCQVPLKTVYDWNSSGTGPRRIRVGKHVRFRQADLDEWLESQTVSSGARGRR